MEDILRAIQRRVESVEKTINLIYRDRDLLEETSIRVRTLEDTVKHLNERIAKLEKNLTADIKDVKESVDIIAEGGD